MAYWGVGCCTKNKQNIVDCHVSYVGVVAVPAPTSTSENTRAGTRDADEAGTAKATISDGYIHTIQHATSVHARWMNAFT